MNPVLRRSFRLVCSLTEIPAVEALLTAQGFVSEPEPFCVLARRLVHEPFPLGRSLAAFFGLIYIQDRSSMLPPLALNPSLGACVLDMCASPGSKTGLLAQLTGPNGLVLANEPAHPRLNTLRRNLLSLNLLHAITCCWPGEELPLPAGQHGQGWNFILLDPPCSGWGTTDKHPHMLKHWKGERIKPLVALQRRLLVNASRLLNPGGRLVYSTCTTNVDENEMQTLFAMDELGLTLQPLALPAGFSLADPMDSRCAGVLRIDEDASNAQGFYVAGFTKPDDRQNEVLPSPREVDLPTFSDAASSAPYELLSKKTFQSFGLDPNRLPPGEIGLLGDAVHFLPQQALIRLPPSLRWQGPALGKTSGGNVIPSPRLRSLLNPTDTHMPRLDLDDAKALGGLLQGQSLVTGLAGKEAALFWQGLALGRLRLKNGRALWAEK